MIFHFGHHYKNYELADFLIKSGVDLDIQDNNGNTPLLLASYHSDKISSKLLIDNGATVKVFLILRRSIQIIQN